VALGAVARRDHPAPVVRTPVRLPLASA
jgi:hypothetical protein